MSRAFVRGCLGKRRYASADAARGASFKYRRTKGGATKPYRCRVCGLYHLTKRSARK